MTTNPIPSPAPTLGERIRIDRRWYRVTSTNATVDGTSHHILLAPLVSRQGEPALLALTLAELSALTTGSLGRTRQKQQGYAQSVQNPSHSPATPRAKNVSVSTADQTSSLLPPIDTRQTANLAQPTTSPAPSSPHQPPSPPLYAPNPPQPIPHYAHHGLALVLAFFAIVAFLTLAPGTALVVCAVGAVLWMGVRGATSTNSKPKGRRR